MMVNPNEMKGKRIPARRMIPQTTYIIERNIPCECPDQKHNGLQMYIVDFCKFAVDDGEEVAVFDGDIGLEVSELQQCKVYPVRHRISRLVNEGPVREE